MNYPSPTLLSLTLLLFTSLHCQGSKGIKVSHLKLQEINEQKVGWHISADQSCFDKNGQTIECTGAQCRLVECDITVGLINAEKSIIKRNKKIIHLVGNVNGTIHGLAFRATDVDYFMKDHLLITKKTAHFTHPTFTTQARHVCVDVKKKMIKLKGNVVSEVFL